MSDIMRPISFAHLMDWILNEYENQGTIFGEDKLVFHKGGARPIFKEKIETPFGAAAGPNTQLAQNLIAAYVTGSRFFELKTVQQMDGRELSKRVNKPCILANDEGYNCEWSTELTVIEAQDEYIKAWVACKVLAKEFGFGDPDGFVFNMSVGYDLKGIKTPKVDSFIDNLMDASNTEAFKGAIEWLEDNLGRFKHVDKAFVESITPHVSDSITESTLHGCPPEEIERIATHLIENKHLNTFIKCNPTLVGYEKARKLLDSLGFDYIIFDSHHFDEDLQWKDAIPMFKRLQKLADEQGLDFGVKLTNTFPVDVTRRELPSEEMYMSGCALYPLSLTLADMLSSEFGGKLRISYCGGADVTNIYGLIDAGIWPVTMATNLLKPGGYGRQQQIAKILEDVDDKPFSGVDVKALDKLVDQIPYTPQLRHSIKLLPERHIDKPLPLLDCFIAPCREQCPIHQDIPGYLMACNRGDYAEALHIILESNALPFMTGTLCPHGCCNVCMRNYYEEFVHIRDYKLLAAQKGFDTVIKELAPRGEQEGKNVAVIGGGPAGLAVASFLSRVGVSVTVFERAMVLGGVPRRVIPGFRISDGAIAHDVELCRAYGARFETGKNIKSADELLDQGYTDVVIAVGAWAKGRGVLSKDQTDGSAKLLDALEFLEAFRADPSSVELGTDVGVVGGGNTAMDVARAAKRVFGVKNVRLVYRRNRRYMPADEEELQEAIGEGVEFLELLAPKSQKAGMLTCEVMELGEPDESGRRRPVPTGKTQDVPATAIISAIGERVEQDVFTASNIEVDRKGRPVVDENLKTSRDHVYAIGDARRGPSVIVKVEADAQTVAHVLSGATFDGQAAKNINPNYDEPLASRGHLFDKCTMAEGPRCLGCPTVCETCVEVCPNRANVAVRVPGMRERQIIHMDGMCNECGNCAVFCPYAGRPYKDKLTLFWSREDFDDSDNEGFLKTEDGMLVRFDGKAAVYNIDDESCGLPENVRKMIQTVRDSYGYLLER